MDIEDIEVFIGIDVGKSEHWATALSRDGRKALDKALPNDEDRLREVYQRLQAKGQVLVVVDQPATIGALAGARRRPGSHRRLAHPGRAEARG